MTSARAQYGRGQMWLLCLLALWSLCCGHALAQKASQNFSADLELSISAEPSLAAPHEPILTSINVTNLGDGPAVKARLLSILPVGLTLVSLSASQGECESFARTVSCEFGQLERGESAIALLVLKSTQPGGFTIAANAITDSRDPNLSNNSDRLPLTIRVPTAPAELRLTRERISPSPALPGEAVTVRLWLENIGGTASDFDVQDDVGSLLQAEQPPRFEGRLEPGERRELVYRARVLFGPPASNTLKATATAPDTASVRAEIPFQRSNVGLTLRANTGGVALRPGVPARFELSLYNPLMRPINLILQQEAAGLNLNVADLAPIALKPLEQTTITVLGRADSADTYTYTARVTLDDALVAPEAVLNITAVALPMPERSSTLRLEFSLRQIPEQAQVVLTYRLPDGAEYQPGSSQLNGETLPDPSILEDRLFWMMPRLKNATQNAAQKSHQLALTVTHSQAIATVERLGVLVQLPQPDNRPPEYRVVQGEALLADLYQRAIAPVALPATRERVGALIVNPTQGTLFRDRDQINVLVDLPLYAENTELMVNGAPVSATKIGSRTFDEGTGRLTLEFVAVQLRPGRNELHLRTSDGGQNFEDRSFVLVAGTAARIVIEPSSPITTDPQDRPALRIRITDVNNLPVADGTLTLETQPEPALNDADPQAPGLQVRYTNGVVNVPLTAVGERGTIRVEARIGALAQSAEFPVVSSQRAPMVIGTGAIELRAGEVFSIGAGFQGFARGSLGEGFLLTAGVNVNVRFDGDFSSSGALIPTANPFERFPLLGDAAQRGSDTNSNDGFYIKLERGASYVLYGTFSPNFQGRLSTYGARSQGAQVLYRESDLSATAFVAWQPQATLNNTAATRPYGAPGDGTSLYRIERAPVRYGSERVRVITRAAGNTGLIIGEKTLERLKDYAIDYVSGVITLTKPLGTADENGNTLFLLIEYSSDGDDVPLELRAGAQARYQPGDWRFSATTLAFSPTRAPLFSLGAAYNSGPLRFDAELGYASDWALSSVASYREGGFEANLGYQNYGLNYIGPNTVTPGTEVRAAAAYSITNALKLSAALSYTRNYTTLEDRTEYALLGSNNFGTFTASLGLRGSSANSLTSTSLVSSSSVYAVAGVLVPFGPNNFTAELRAPLNEAPFQIALGLEYALTDTIKLELRDTISTDGTNQGSIGLRGAFGTTNVAAAYELPLGPGDGGRARIGLETIIPIDKTWSAQLGGELSAPFQNDWSANLSFGALFTRDDVRGSFTNQVAFSNKGPKYVFKFSAISLNTNEPISLSPSFEFTSGFEGAGVRFSIASVYRLDNVIVLMQNQLRSGIYAPAGDEFTGEVQSSWVVSQTFSVRGGVAYKYSNEIFTGQLNAGLRYWVQDNIGLGGQLIYQFQPGYSNRIAAGLEATLRVTDNLAFTAGMNLIGFDGGLGLSNTQTGFYFRLEFLFDERTLGWGK